MKLIRNAFALGIAVAAISVAACSTQSGSTGTGGSGNGTTASLNGNPSQGDVGTIAARLAIAPGVTIPALNWTITSTTNSSLQYTGVVQILNDAGVAANSVEFVAGGILAGTYTVALSGSDSNGDPCATPSPATVTVTAGATSSAVVLVTCTSPTDAALAADVTTGSIAVDAGVTLTGQSPYQCPGISSFAISPAEVLPPETAALSSTSTSFSGGSETFLWSTTCSGATITNATSANATFSCGSELGVTCPVTLTVNLDGVSAGGGDAGLVCPGTTAFFEQYTANVVCEQGTLQCFAPTSLCTSDAGPDAGSFCTNLQTDPNNCGSCAHVCPASTPTCSGGTCIAPLATACTSAPCVAGTVECQGNTSGACTATEAIFVTQDISVNKITAVSATPAIADVAAGCYTCLLAAGCLDDNEFGDTGHECGDGPGATTSDLPATFVNGSGTTVNSTSTCIATAQCVISQGCGTAANGGLTNCYCGSEGGGPSACATATSVNGACETSELAGFSHSDNSDIINKDFTNTLEPSGMANQIFSCGKTACAQCLN